MATLFFGVFGLLVFVVGLVLSVSGYIWLEDRLTKPSEQFRLEACTVGGLTALILLLLAYLV